MILRLLAFMLMTPFAASAAWQLDTGKNSPGATLIQLAKPYHLEFAASPENCALAGMRVVFDREPPRVQISYVQGEIVVDEKWLKVGSNAIHSRGKPSQFRIYSGHFSKLKTLFDNEGALTFTARNPEDHKKADRFKFDLSGFSEAWLQTNHACLENMRYLKNINQAKTQKPQRPAAPQTKTTPGRTQLERFSVEPKSSRVPVY